MVVCKERLDCVRTPRKRRILDDNVTVQSLSVLPYPSCICSILRRVPALRKSRSDTDSPLSLKSRAASLLVTLCCSACVDDAGRNERSLSTVHRSTRAKRTRSDSAPWQCARPATRSAIGVSGRIGVEMSTNSGHRVLSTTSASRLRSWSSRVSRC